MGFLIQPFEEGVHRAALLALWQENFSVFADGRARAAAEQRFRWFYGENPEGPPHTWVALAGSQVGGCVSLCPRAISRAGVRLRVGIACDYAVAKASRAYGPALSLLRTLTREAPAAGFDLILGYPNQSGKGVVERAGLQVLGEAERWVKPLRTDRYLAARIPVAPVAAAASLAANLGLTLADSLRTATRLPARLQHRVEMLEAADPRFDTLWEEVRGDEAVVGEMSSAYLNWRYARCPTERYRFFALSHRSGALTAFLVFAAREREVFVIDLLARDREETLPLLLDAFTAAMRREGHHSVCLICLGNPALRRILQRCWFLRSGDPRSVVARVTSEAAEPYRQALLAPDQWLLLEGGMDM